MGGTLLLYNPDRNQKLFDLARPTWKWGDTNYRSIIGPHAGAEVGMEHSLLDFVTMAHSQPEALPPGSTVQPIYRPPAALFGVDFGSIFDDPFGDLIPGIFDFNRPLGSAGGSAPSGSAGATAGNTPSTGNLDWLKAYVTGRGEESLYTTVRDFMLSGIGALIIVVAIYFLLKD